MPHLPPQLFQFSPGITNSVCSPKGQTSVRSAQVFAARVQEHMMLQQHKPTPCLAAGLTQKRQNVQTAQFPLKNKWIFTSSSTKTKQKVCQMLSSIRFICVQAEVR